MIMTILHVILYFSVGILTTAMVSVNLNTAGKILKRKRDLALICVVWPIFMAGLIADLIVDWLERK